MVDLTSGAFGFHQAVAAGDFFEALGLPENARKLDIDVAAARWAERAPWMAKDLVAVAGVLTRPDRRKIFETGRGHNYE